MPPELSCNTNPTGREFIVARLYPVESFLRARLVSTKGDRARYLLKVQRSAVYMQADQVIFWKLLPTESAVPEVAQFSDRGNRTGTVPVPTDAEQRFEKLRIGINHFASSPGPVLKLVVKENRASQKPMFRVWPLNVEITSKTADEVGTFGGAESPNQPRA